MQISVGKTGQIKAPPGPSTGLGVTAAMIAYAIAFKLSHLLAAQWGSAYFYSLWYPAAGVRLAFLWHFGARWTPVVVAIEVAVQVVTGVIAADSPAMVFDIIGVARSPIIYGLVVALIRWIESRGRTELAVAPMPFALAAVIAPIASAFFSVATDALWPSATNILPTTAKMTSIVAFLLGDLLGVLLIAPALLWSSNAISDKTPLKQMPLPRLVEAAAVFGVGWALASLLRPVGDGLFAMPVLLATIWVGLRCGRGAAWVAIMVTALDVLPDTGVGVPMATRLTIHMGLVAIAISGYLAGSFSDAQNQARRDIARRDRILFQADRLKTLRAMSVAVIHELSQPLSTLAIESRHLEAISADPSGDVEEIAQSAALIARKVATLADMVRRLRRFGGRAVDEPSQIPVSRLIDDAVELIRTEMTSTSSRVVVAPIAADLITRGQETELTQALLNILRNAMAASPNGTITLEAKLSPNMVLITIANQIVANRADYAGMGIGAIIARTIIEAHGGRIVQTHVDGLVTHDIQLPIENADL